MALPTTRSFAGVILYVETAPGSGVYVQRMCGFSQKALDLTAQTSTGLVPDCNNPEGASWDVSGVSSKGGKITLSGVYAEEDEPFWNTWFDNTTAYGIRWVKAAVGFRAGPGLLTALGESTELRQDANLLKRSITIENAGAWPWTAGDPPA